MGALAEGIDEFAETIDIPLFKALFKSAAGAVELGEKGLSAAGSGIANAADTAIAKSQTAISGFSPNSTPTVSSENIEKSAPSQQIAIEKSDVAAPDMGNNAPSVEMQAALDKVGDLRQSFAMQDVGGAGNLGDMSQTVAASQEFHEMQKQQQANGLG